MSKTKSKVLAILMSVVLALSMTSAAAISAFAAELTAGVIPQATGDIVYDSVYGVVGGKYSLMMKSVVTERQYNGRMMKFTETLTDVMRSDGTVMLRTSTEPLGKPGIDGTEVAYDIDALNLYQTDLSNGYVKLVDKMTGKTGLKKLEGDGWLVACEFNNLQPNPDGDGFIGFAFNENTVKAEFLDQSGSSVCTFDIPAAQGEYGYRSAHAYRMENGWIGIEASNFGNSASLILKKTANGYEVALPDLKNVLTSDGAGNMIIEKKDGSICYYAASGQETLIAASGEFAATWIEGQLFSGYALVTFYDDEGDESVCRYCIIGKDQVLDSNRTFARDYDDGEVLVQETNGNVSMISADGKVVTIELNETDVAMLDGASFEGGFICLNFYNEANDEYSYRYYSRETGIQLDIAEDNIWGMADGYVLVVTEEDSYDEGGEFSGTYSRYAIYDSEGNEVVYTNSPDEGLALLEGGRYGKITTKMPADYADDPTYKFDIYGMDGKLQVSLGEFPNWPNARDLEELYISIMVTKSTMIPGADEDDDDPWIYETSLSIYKTDGTLVKEFGPYSGRSASIYSIRDSGPSTQWKSVVIGYGVYYEDADENEFEEYYDTAFNKLKAEPELDDSDDPYYPDEPSGSELMFGSKAVKITRGSSYNPSTDTYEFKVTVTDEQGKPIMANGYVLGIAANPGKFAIYNALKHGSADVWWATNSAGKWGAIDSKGNVIIPFDLESYYDAGYDGTNLVMVKKSGVWGFYDYVNKTYVPSGDPIVPSKTTPKPTPTKGIAVGKTATVGGVVYKVLSNSPATVTLFKAPKTKKGVTAPKSVTINKKAYAVVGIAKNAFKGAKAKTVTVKTPKLTKKSVKGCFKGSKVKTVKVSLGSKKANRAAVKKYKKIFTKANCGAKVTVK